MEFSGTTAAYDSDGHFFFENQLMPRALMGYQGGLVVGDAREVRIFDVQHIKGMEFEAVFFSALTGWPNAYPACSFGFFM
jgi:hypothetical protein